MDKTAVIKLDYKFFETCGANSLIGLIANEFQSIPNKVLLLFPAPSLNWHRQNTGPYLVIQPSHVVACFSKDLVWLMTNGCEVTIDVYTLDPT